MHILSLGKYADLESPEPGAKYSSALAWTSQNQARQAQAMGSTAQTKISQVRHCVRFETPLNLPHLDIQNFYLCPSFACFALARLG